MSERSERTILVAGTGPAGLAAALALAAAGREVVLAGPSPALEDRRTTALMHPSVRFLEELGLAEALRAH
ncbi:FAD-dependent monooxygenase, partial [Nitratireductor sp. GCM10026969]|uniref:FAD-dependent monooxygenase n=1 Tax=Nitratireductor sp. GCM10026969 TaxID=3252645 RepID=UPI00360CD05C